MAIKIITRKLKLRPMGNEDKYFLIENMSNKEISGCLVGVSNPYTRNDANDWINQCNTKKSILNFGIQLKDNGLIGEIGFNPINFKKGYGDLMYWIKKESQGKGYASEAISSLIDYSFGVLNLNSINLETFVDNVSSNHLAKKFGFNYIGSREKTYDILSQTEVKRENIYLLTKKEYKKRV